MKIIKELKADDGLKILSEQLKRLFEFVELDEALLRRINTEVSSWSALEHLEHLSVTGRSGLPLTLEACQNPSLSSMKKADPLFYKLKDLGHFPRGETQSPDFAKPRGMAQSKAKKSFERMSRLLQELVTFLEKTSQNMTGRSEHPRLGFLNGEQWIHFMVLHQGHHLQIISEILRV